MSLAMGLGAGPAGAAAPVLPTGLTVANGQAQVAVDGGRMTVTNSAQAILNWNSFSIGAGNGVYFQQPTASSQVLNRVTGSDPSSILGSLGSNGKVWLLNPNGVLFGTNARIDVGGLVVSTLRLNDSDWAAGRFRLAAEPGDSATAGVVNQGEIRTVLGGRLALVGGTVDNQGLMQAPDGQVILAAGRSVELVDTGAPNLSVVITAPGGQARNLGVLETGGGRIDITAAAVNQSGIVRADALDTSPGGEVWIRASQSVDLGAGSRTSANGGTGGTVSVQADAGATLVQGSISATGAQGAGGSVAVLGRQVGLLDGAAIDASGATGGGHVVVGGGDRGQDLRYANAQALYFSPLASITADATRLGDGGHVVLWSDQSTRAYGALSARGGQLGGNGGSIETSGGWLDARPTRVDTGSTGGLAGLWLLDPYNITISDVAVDNLGTGPNFSAGATGSAINASTISSALAGGSNVIVSTGGSNGGAEAGNITLSNATIFVGAGVVSPGSLTLLADGTIDMLNSTIQSDGGAMGVTFTAALSGVGAINVLGSAIVSGSGSSHGAIVFGGPVSGTTPTGGSFSGAGGAVTTGSTFAGIDVTNSSLDAGTANLRMAGVSTHPSGFGVFLSNAALIGGHVTITGDAPSYRGVVLTSEASITATSGISVLGRGSDLGVGLFGAKSIVLSPTVFDATAQLLVQGRGLTNRGVFVVGSAAVNSTFVASNGAGATIEGAAGQPNLNAVELLGSGGINPLIDASTGTTLTLRSFDTGWLRVDDSIVRGGTGLSALRASQVDLTNAVVRAEGQVTVTANTVNLFGTTRLSSAASGDAVLVSGQNAPLVRFLNSAGSTALSVFSLNAAPPLGRWIVYATDINDGANFAAGGLIPAFKRYGASYGGWASDVGNGLVFSAAQTATITATVQSRTYDGTTTATLTNLGVSTSVAGDTGTLVNGNASFATRNAGVGIAVSLDAAVPYTFMDGNSVPVYGYTFVSNLSGTITPRALTAAVSVANKVYDATTAAVATVNSLTGLVGSEQLGLLTSASFASKNVGNNVPVSVGLALQDGANGGLASNYSLVSPIALTASITPLALNVSGLSASNKVYDATTAATLSGTGSISALAGDTVTLGGTATAQFVDKNVGTAKPVSVTGYTLSGADAGNYTLQFSPGLMASITPLALAVGGITANSKVYDATTVATLSGTATFGALGNDVVTLGGAPTAQFADKNVGTAKPVTVTGYTLSGADAGNYSLLFPANLNASITPLALTASGISANNKVYDATTAATLSGTATVGALAGDAVTLGGTASAQFANKNVGIAKPVTVTGYSLGGADAGNYSLQGPSGLTASITPLSLVVSGLTANNKVYDATRAATLAGTASIAALAGDSVTLGGTAATAQFADKNLGSAKPVTVTGYTLSGADSGNYSLQSPTILSASITPLALVVSGLSANTKIYDATTVATLSGTASIASLAGDVVALGGSPAAQFANKNVGIAKPVTVSGYTLSGADAGNYTLQFAPGLTASITPLAVAISGVTANNKVYDATTAATLSGTAIVGALAGDTVMVGGTPTAQFANRNVGNAKPLSVTGYTLSGADAGNYSVQFPANLSANITLAQLLYVADPVVRVVGQPIGTLTGTVTGFLGGETLATATTGTLSFTTTAGSVALPGTYSIFGAGLAAGNYGFAQATSNLQALRMVGGNGPDESASVNCVLGSSTVGKKFANCVATMLETPARIEDSGVLDLVATTSFDGPVQPVSDFGAVRLDDLSDEALQQLLAGRKLFKDTLLADATAQLVKEPGLADLPVCDSVVDAERGRCLMTEVVKGRFLQMQPRPGAVPPPAVAAAPGAAASAPTTSSVPPPIAPTPSAAVPTPTPAPVVVATPSTPIPAGPLRRPDLPPGVDPLQAQLDRMLAQYRVRWAALPQIERKIAVVVGVDRYADTAIPPLGNAVRDARSVAELFQARLGYEPIVLENATKASLVATLNHLALTIGPSDSVVVYYAGHGELIESTKMGYWMLSDSSSKDPKTWLSNADISRLIGQINARQVALISDSCYSGSLATDERIRAAAQTPDPQAVLARKSVVVMTSGGNEPVADEGRDGHSPFAWNLMSTLNNVNDWRPGGNIFERVRFAVARTLPQRPQYSASRDGGHQPGGDFLFENRQIGAAK